MDRKFTNWQKLKVASRTDEGSNVISLELVCPEGGELSAFDAGSHIDVLTGSGQIRQYSLCNNPLDRWRYRIAVALHPNSRGGSSSIHEQLLEGNSVLVGSPRNNFSLAGDSAPSILLAKDIGITPLLAMAWKLHGQGLDFKLCYIARNASRIAFSDELTKAPFADKVIIFQGDVSQYFEGPGKHQLTQHNAKWLYICGSNAFVRHSMERVIEFGWDASNIRFEGFTPDPLAERQKLDIVAAKSGLTVSVTPPQSIASALIEAGVSVELSCEQGICGTCLTDVIGGIPEHRDSCQTRDEKSTNKQIAICCSWSNTPTLVLDI